MKVLSLTTVVVGIFSGVLARSSVYFNNEKPIETKQVSMDGFSLFYSHLMNGQSGLHLQQGAQADAQTIMSSFELMNKDLFQRNIDANMMVIVAGVNEPEAILKQEASLYVTEDATEKYVDMVEKSVDETLENKNDGTISIYKQTETIQENLDSFKSQYAHRQTDVFDENNKVDRDFINEVQAVREFILALVDSDDKKQKALNSVDIEFIEMNTLQAIGDEYGVASAQYKEATLILSDLFNEVIIPNFRPSSSSVLSTFIFTPYSSSSNRRISMLKATFQPAQECYTTLKSCNNGTDSCSNGNGECIERSEGCFSCQCTGYNVGNACEYINSVADFQLLFWTGVFFIVTTAGVLTFVYKSGDIEHGSMLNSLPKQE
ncbi:hypothetical protein K501DRAFT_246630 [Backusella circina FSU 941]|nr:hypothetical protein K501DRAFT_246630 [Backusella circina FSU 941]